MWSHQSPVPQQQMEEAIRENPAIKDTFTPRISREQIVQEIDHSQVGVAYLEGEPTAIFIAAAETMDKFYLETFLQQRGVTMVWWTLQKGPLPEVPLMDLDPSRYAAILNNIVPELQDLWEGLADIARERASPESRRTAQALQQVHASDYKVFLTKFLLLGQNWEHTPALRTALGNWACDCVFEHALLLVKRELAQQRDTAWGALDNYTEMAQAIGKQKPKQINEQRRKANLSLLVITEGKMASSKQQMLGSVGETLGRPMATLTVLGNGHCLAASVAVAVFGTASLTPLVVKQVVACLRDNPQFQEELHTAMGLQGLMEEEDTRSFEERKDIYLNGLLAGDIWMDQPELSIMCQIYQTQIFVWQCDQDGEPQGLAVPQAQSTIDFTNTVHLYLRDGHYEPMVPMDVLHQFARSDTDALPDFLTTHTVQWVMDRHAILRVEAQAAAVAATGAAGEKVAMPKPKAASVKNTLGSAKQQPGQRRNAAAVPTPQGRGAYHKPPAGAASPMQPEPTTCNNQFAALAEPIAEETPALDPYTAGGSMDAGQGSGGVSTSTYSETVMPRAFRASPVPFPNGMSGTPLGFPGAQRARGSTGRGGYSTGRGGYGNMGTRTPTPKFITRNRHCINQLQDLSADANADVALKAWYYTNGTHGQVQGRLTVQGPIAGLQQLARLLRDHCPMALLCKRADKKFYNILGEGCLEAEQWSMKANGRYLWQVDEVLSIVEKTGGHIIQLFAQQETHSHAGSEEDDEALYTSPPNGNGPPVMGKVAKPPEQAAPPVQILQRHQPLAGQQKQQLQVPVDSTALVQPSPVQQGSGPAADRVRLGGPTSGPRLMAADTGDSALKTVVQRKSAETQFTSAARGTVDADTVTQVNMTPALAPSTLEEHRSAGLAWQQQQARAHELELQRRQAQYDLEQERNQLAQERIQLEQQRVTQAIEVARQQQQQSAERMHAQLENQNQKFHTMMSKLMHEVAQEVKQLKTRMDAQEQPAGRDQGAQQPSTHTDTATAMVGPMQPEVVDRFGDGGLHPDKVWDRLCYSHSCAQLSIAENQAAQHLVMEGPALGEHADNQLLAYHAKKQLTALSTNLQGFRTQHFPDGMKPVAVIGTVHALREKTTEECSICGCNADFITRRKATFRCGGSAAQHEWGQGAQGQLHALRHGQLCAKCTGTLRDDDGQQPWLVYDAMQQEYRAPSREEQVLGVQGVERRRWEAERSFLDFEQIPNMRKQPLPPTPGRFSTLHNSIACGTSALPSPTTLPPQTSLVLAHAGHKKTSTSQDVRYQPHKDTLEQDQARQLLSSVQDHDSRKETPSKKTKVTPTRRKRKSHGHGDSSDESSTSGSSKSDRREPPGGGDSGGESSEDGEGNGSDRSSRGAGGSAGRVFETRDQAELRKRQDKTLESIGRYVKDNITIMDKEIHKLAPLQRAKAVQRGLVQIRKLMAMARREIQSLLAILPEASYELVDKIMNRMLPKGSDIDQLWSEEVATTHIRTSSKWDDPEKVIPAWIIKKLVITDQDQKLCLEAALEEMRSLSRISPKEAARIILELRDIVKALGYGSQLTIPMIGATIARTLSNTVKARLSDWAVQQKVLGRFPHAKLDKLPSNYTRKNLMVIVTKAQSFYVQTASSPTARTSTTGTSRYPRGARVAHAAEVDETQLMADSYLPEGSDRGGSDASGERSDVGSDDDICAALQSPVGGTGPMRRAYQHSPTRWQGQKGQERPKKGQVVQRSGTASVMATGAVLHADLCAIVTDEHFEGCWNCGGKHYQRDCPKMLQGNTPIMKALKEVQHQKDIVGNPRLAATVALQGVSAAVFAVLPAEASGALVAYLGSGVPELYEDWAKGVSNQA